MLVASLDWTTIFQSKFAQLKPLAPSVSFTSRTLPENMVFEGVIAATAPASVLGSSIHLPSSARARLGNSPVSPFNLLKSVTLHRGEVVATLTDEQRASACF